MDVVTAILEALRGVLGLILVGLGGEEPGVAGGIDDTGGSRTNGTSDVVAS